MLYYIVCALCFVAAVYVLKLLLLCLLSSTRQRLSNNYCPEDKKRKIIRDICCCIVYNLIKTCHWAVLKMTCLFRFLLFFASFKARAFASFAISFGSSALVCLDLSLNWSMCVKSCLLLKVMYVCLHRCSAQSRHVTFKYCLKYISSCMLRQRTLNNSSYDLSVGSAENPKVLAVFADTYSTVNSRGC